MSTVSTPARLLTARWVLPMSGLPIENGGLEIADGKIVGVYSGEQLPDRRREIGDARLVSDFGQSIIVPGFINLHTHLEWTAQQLCDTQSSLFQWVPILINDAKNWTPEDFLTSARDGARRIAASGTTCVFDSAPTGQAAVALSEIGLRGVVALELFGLDESRAKLSWDKWLAAKDQLTKNNPISDLVKISVAPHAPYTVSAELFKLATDWAQSHGLPLTMHISESGIEFDWVMSGNAELDKHVKAVCKMDDAALSAIACRNCRQTPVEFLDSHSLLGPWLLAAHAVKLSDGDIKTLAKRDVKVAHCARSNARLRNGVAPLRQMVDAGIKVGFGTDSLASCDDLDVLAEARFAWNLHRAIDPSFPFESERAIRALTLDAASAIGMSDFIGSLEEGKQADIAIFNIASQSPWADKRPYDALLHGNCVLEELWVGGRKVEPNALY